MKLLIEIPEEAKQAFDCTSYYDHCGYYDHGGVVGKAIKNGKPLDTVLDEIRAEIEEMKLDVDLDIGNEMIYNNAIKDVLQMIDKYRAESERV